jgi:hypothetical protein
LGEKARGAAIGCDPLECARGSEALGLTSMSAREGPSNDTRQP